MNRKELFSLIQKQSSFLCVGLDPDIKKIPEHLLSEPDPIFAFNQQIIDATADHCVAYKPNLAFYESLGPKGMESFQKTIEHIPSTHMIIADAKRGDIGNTSSMYARTFFDTYGCDALTVAPYMGEDSVTPFLGYEGKWVIVLGLTSNKGSLDFQHLSVDNQPLHIKVMEKVKQWGTPDNIMFVVGATQAEKLKEIRDIIPDHFLLVPGVGAQGGSLEEVAQNGMNKECGLLVNSSRGIIYAGDGSDFAKIAGQKAEQISEQMTTLLEKYL